MLSVVIPMYNAAGQITSTVDKLRAFFNANGIAGQLVLVNDGSSDDTPVVCDMLLGENDRYVEYSPNRGKGYAMRQGALAAEGGCVLFIDADLAYGTEIIKDALDLMRSSGADIVIGSRHMNSQAYSNYPPLRKAASFCFSFLVERITNVKFKDTQCGFKLYTSRAVGEIFPRLAVDRFAVDLEILLLAQKKGLKVAEIPAKVLIHGASSVSVLKDSVKMLIDAVKIKNIHKGE